MIRTISTYAIHLLSISLRQDVDGPPQTAAIGVPGEITATSVLVTYWDTNVSYEKTVFWGRSDRQKLAQAYARLHHGCDPFRDWRQLSGCQVLR